MKKIRDFIYDYNDIFLAILIIVVAAAVIFWKVSDIMAYTGATASSSTSTAAVDMSNVDLTIQPVENINPDPEEITTSAVQTPDPPVTPIQTVTKDTSFTVPSGSSSGKIASLLEQAGLIKSKDEFTALVKEMGVETKLKAGTFTIPAGSTMEDIAKILSK